MGRKPANKQPSGFSDALLDETVSIFQPRTERELTREDGRQIAQNLSGFFHTLLEWKKARSSHQTATLIQRNHKPAREARPADTPDGASDDPPGRRSVRDRLPSSTDSTSLPGEVEC